MRFFCIRLWLFVVTHVVLMSAQPTSFSVHAMTELPGLTAQNAATPSL